MIRLLFWVIDTSGPTLIEQWKQLDEKVKRDGARGRPVPDPRMGIYRDEQLEISQR